MTYPGALHDDQARRERWPIYALAAFCLALIAYSIGFSIATGGVAGLPGKMLAIIVEPDVLINDYVARSGWDGALLNAGLAAAMVLGVLAITKVHFSGPAIAAIFTVAGFSLFGKNVFNILPVMGGVALFALAAGQRFSENALVAAFGTTLAPVVSEFAFAFGIPAPWNMLAGIAAGAAVGFMLPPIARNALDFHRGYNIYNIGFTGGLVGMSIMSILRSFSVKVSSESTWSEGPWYDIAPFLALVFVALIVAGMRIDPLWRLEYGKLLKCTGRLVSDFTRQFGLGATMVNMGIMGIIALGFVFAIGGDWNGPVVGGILTVVGFSAFGKHPLNAVWPMLGVLATSGLTHLEIGGQATQLAALFATTLAPIGGSYGPVAGFAAGMLHMVIVVNVGQLHGGMNLYNNGFSGGLTAGILVPILDWLKERRKHED
jgi:hypothetical protein